MAIAIIGVDGDWIAWEQIGNKLLLAISSHL